MVKNMTQSSAPMFFLRIRAYSLRNTTARAMEHSVQKTANIAGPLLRLPPAGGEGGVVAMLYSARLAHQVDANENETTVLRTPGKSDKKRKSVVRSGARRGWEKGAEVAFPSWLILRRR